MSKQILVVDDVELERTILCDILEQLGYSSVAVPRAADVFRLNLADFSAILADVNMPQMDGRSLLVAVRETKGSQIPFVFVTGTDDPRPLVADAVRYEAEYLPKPVTPADIEELLGRLIGPPN